MRHPCLTWWPEKFFADTAHVTGEAAAYYMILIGHAWVRGGSLPNDPHQLRLMSRCEPKRWPHVWRQIEPFWTLGDDGRLHQKRLDEEWRKATDRHDPKAENGISQIRKRDSVNGKKARKNNGQQLYSARARDSTPTPTQKNSAFQAESSSGARAPLSAREPHATPALRLVGNDEPVPPVDDQPAAPDEAERARIAEGLARLASSIVNPDRLTAPGSGTIAELERNAAAEKLAEWKPAPVIPSPTLAAALSRKPNGHGAGT